METIGYIFIYFLTGTLPWSGLALDDKEEKVKRAGEMKEKLTPEELT